MMGGRAWEESDKSGGGWKNEDDVMFFIILYTPIHTVSLARKNRPNLLATHPPLLPFSAVISFCQIPATSPTSRCQRRYTYSDHPSATPFLPQAGHSFLLPSRCFLQSPKPPPNTPQYKKNATFITDLVFTKTRIPLLKKWQPERIE